MIQATLKYFLLELTDKSFSPSGISNIQLVNTLNFDPPSSEGLLNLNRDERSIQLLVQATSCNGTICVTRSDSKLRCIECSVVPEYNVVDFANVTAQAFIAVPIVLRVDFYGSPNRLVRASVRTPLVIVRLGAFLVIIKI